MGLALVDSQTPFRKCLKLRSILGRGSFSFLRRHDHKRTMHSWLLDDEPRRILLTYEDSDASSSVLR